MTGNLYSGLELDPHLCNILEMLRQHPTKYPRLYDLVHSACKRHGLRYEYFIN